MTNTKFSFIIESVKAGNIYWTYHVNMRLAGRVISRDTILRHIASGEIIEEYENDFPLPSCLCLLYDENSNPVHVLIALDQENNHVRCVTAYRPDPDLWDSEFKRRR